MITVGDFPIGPEERAVIEEVLDSGHLSEGQKVKKFELEFAKKMGANYCVAVSSGTSALIVGLLALIHSGEIKPGTKVITSPITYIATANAILLAGLEPVFVDIDPRTLCITPENIENLLKHGNPKEYSLILPVHLMGYPCDMIGINAVAQKYDLQVFEDAAQAHGTKIDGKCVGTFSTLAAFSFYIAHNIQVGEMGAVLTNSRKLASLIRSLKANGRACDCLVCTRKEGTCPRISEESDLDPRFTHNYVGYNFKTMEFQAALGLLQLKRLDDIIDKRYQNVCMLNDTLVDYRHNLMLPIRSARISYLAYQMVIDRACKVPRKLMRSELERRGIETRPLFGCIPTQQPSFSKYKDLYEGKLPNAEYAGLNGFYVGCHQYLTYENIKYIGENIKEILK